MKKRNENVHLVFYYFCVDNYVTYYYDFIYLFIFDVVF